MTAIDNVVSAIAMDSCTGNRCKPLIVGPPKDGATVDPESLAAAVCGDAALPLSALNGLSGMFKGVIKDCGRLVVIDRDIELAIVVGLSAVDNQLRSCDVSRNRNRKR